MIFCQASKETTDLEEVQLAFAETKGRGPAERKRARKEAPGMEG